MVTDLSCSNSVLSKPAWWACYWVREDEHITGTHSIIFKYFQKDLNLKVNEILVSTNIFVLSYAKHHFREKKSVTSFRTQFSTLTLEKGEEEVFILSSTSLLLHPHQPSLSQSFSCLGITGSLLQMWIPRVHQTNWIWSSGDCVEWVWEDLQFKQVLQVTFSP